MTDVTLFAEEGNELYKQGQYDKAIQSYDKAVEIDPNNSELWNRIGLALMAMDWIAEAENRFC
jgi:Flp pilus assembly protein TadD